MQDLKYAMDAIHRITQESIDAIVKLYVASGSTGSPNSPPEVNFGEPPNLQNSQDPKQFELREDPRYNILQCNESSLEVKSSGYAGSSPKATTAVNIPKRAEYVDPNLHNFTL